MLVFHNLFCGVFHLIRSPVFSSVNHTVVKVGMTFMCACINRWGRPVKAKGFTHSALYPQLDG